MVKSILFTLLFGLFASNAWAQSVIRGQVVHDENGEPLPGVNVYLEETQQGTATRFDGRFEISDVAPGTYTLVVRLLGHETIERSITAPMEEELLLRLVDEPVDLGEVLAEADRPYTAASSVAIRTFDLLTRPTRSSQDLLRLAPGLITAQHAGGGKAEQIFIRGFDADHGTDVAISIDGMPVNMVSHGHGHGYADLHFIIPEVVNQIDVTKGPHATEYGNLATAGAIAFSTKDHLEENLIRVEGGAFNTASVTALFELPTSGHHQGAYLAGQFYNTDGPVESPQGFQRLNIFGKFHTHLSETARLSLSASGFSSAWDASGQIPQRAVDQGLISRFGTFDDLEGGTTARQNVNLTYQAESGASDFEIQGYASHYHFKLFSNFTFFLENPEQGDMIEQTDDRALIGLNGKYQYRQSLGPVLSLTTLGGGFRSDNIELTLWQSPDRIRTAALVDAAIAERNLFLWLEEEFIFSPQVRLQLGLRGDYFTFDVNDALDLTVDDPDVTLPHASGYAQQAILSPKANLVISPTRDVDVFLNGGMGFHSNDARDVVLGRRIKNLERVLQRQGMNSEAINEALLARNYDPAHRDIGTLPRAVGGEIGMRTRLLDDHVVLSAALWNLDLDEELVFVGDGGFTEPSGRSRRQGVDLESRVRLLDWLTADVDVNLSKGELRDEPDDANSIPLAPTFTSTGGFNVMHPSGINASLRYVHVGDRPANEDGSVTAEGYTLLNLLTTYRRGPIQLSAILENVLDVEWNEAQFDTESRLPGEAASVSELHFTPGSPRNLRLGISYLF